jgi:hypothetical protein
MCAPVIARAKQSTQSKVYKVCKVHKVKSYKINEKTTNNKYVIARAKSEAIQKDSELWIASALRASQ